MSKASAYVDLSDAILKGDKRQSVWSADAKFCPESEDHGRLQVHGSGAVMMCTARGCSHHEQLLRDED